MCIRDRVRVGFVLNTNVGGVAIADVGDDLVIGSWPDPARWSAVEVALDEI